MFTKGRIIFTLLFVIAFATAMVMAYQKDGKHQKYYYKNVWKVGLAIIVVIVLFTILTFWSHE
jgi:sterol desaturase/sphingolipid hydroxylase (fatty acid hydroxylase superfamily)